MMERVHPRQPRVPCPGVLAVRVPDLDAREILLMRDPRKFFTEPHYDGFPAVLVRLEEIGRAELRGLLKQAWAAQAPKTLLPERKERHSDAVAKLARRKRVAHAGKQRIRRAG